MKTSIFFLSFFLAFFTLLDASAQTTKDSTAFNNIIKNYIKGTIQSDFKTLRIVLSNNAELKIPRFDKIILYKKDDLIQQMKSQVRVKLNCTYDYSTLFYSDAIGMAKIKLNYPNFNQFQYLTIEKLNGEWKIIQIIVSYDNLT